MDNAKAAWSSSNAGTVAVDRDPQLGAMEKQSAALCQVAERLANNATEITSGLFGAEPQPSAGNSAGDGRLDWASRVLGNLDYLQRALATLDHQLGRITRELP